MQKAFCVHIPQDDMLLCPCFQDKFTILQILSLIRLLAVQYPRIETTRKEKKNDKKTQISNNVPHATSSN